MRMEWIYDFMDSVGYFLLGVGILLLEGAILATASDGNFSLRQGLKISLLVFGFLSVWLGRNLIYFAFDYEKFIVYLIPITLVGIIIFIYLLRYPFFYRNKFVFTLCGVLVITGFMVSYYLSLGGCLWWECAPTRSFGVEELELPATLFPPDAHVRHVSTHENHTPEIYQKGFQSFWWGESGHISNGHYTIYKYPSSKNPTRYFADREQAIKDMENLGRLPFKPEGINYVSPLADHFYIDCYNDYQYYCTATGQYQEFVLSLYMELDDKMTAQDFQQIVIYMDKQISKFLYEN